MTIYSKIRQITLNSSRIYVLSSKHANKKSCFYVVYKRVIALIYVICNSFYQLQCIYIILIIIMINYRQMGYQIEPESYWQLNNFQILKTLGRGKFGEVKVAREITSDFIVALKIMKRNEISSNNYQQQIKRQITIQSALNHPNLLKIYGYFWDMSSVVLILQYAYKGQLFQHLKKVGRMPQSTVAIILQQVCHGISYLHHNNIIHRDLKPENILVSGQTIKIADFGWAVATNSRRNTFCGTLDYLSPQMLKGEEHDFKVDIWSIGILAFELATGSTPFQEQTYTSTLSKIVQQSVSFPSYLSLDIKRFIKRCLNKDPKQRPSAALLLQDPFIAKYSGGILQL